MATPTSAADAALPTSVPPTGGSGHSPNLATLAQLRSRRGNPLLSTSHRRPTGRDCAGSA